MEEDTHKVLKIFVIIGCILLLCGGIFLYVNYVNKEIGVQDMTPQVGEYAAPKEDFIDKLLLASGGGERLDFADGDTATTNYSVSGGTQEELVVKINETLRENNWDISRVVPVDSMGGKPAYMIFAYHAETQANLQVIIISGEATHQVALMYPNKN